MAGTLSESKGGSKNGRQIAKIDRDKDREKERDKEKGMGNRKRQKIKDQ